MSEIIEKSIAFLLGGILGIAVSFILRATNMPFWSDVHCFGALTIATSAIGIMTSIAWMEYLRDRVIKRNNAIRDETVALITHEMRTGLTSTGWAIEMVIKKYGEKLTGDDKQLLQDVVSSIHTTVMHSVNLLDVSLLDIGKLSISLERTGLNKVEQLFNETLQKYRLGAEKKNTELVKNIKLDPQKSVEVDMLRLRIILENLLENALQYLSENKNTISVDINNENNNLNIKVADTGIGIPESEQQKIFSEFFRASNARKKLSSGSGIGLYTTSQYVKAHRGTIRFESKEGTGTTFFITIPLKTEADVQGFLKQI